MAITQQDRTRALKGLSDLGFTDPDDLELQGFLDENPVQAEPTPEPTINLNDGVSRTPAEIMAARRAAGLDPVTGQAIPETTEPTISDLGLTAPDFSDEDAFLKQQDEFLRGVTAPIDEEKIREDARKRMQAEIDAVNAMFAEQIARERITGRGRLGTETAIGARRGLLGSDFGEAAIRRTEDLNEAQIRSIEAERAAAINALLSEAKSDAQAEIKARREAMLAGFDARKAFFAEAEERKAKRANRAVAAFLSKGITPDQLQSEELSSILRQYGISQDEFSSAYDSALSAQAEAEFEREGELLKRDKTQAEIDKIDADIDLAKEKFAEDKRQFGLDYAIKQANLAVSQGKLQLDREKAARDAGITTGGISPKQQRALDQSNVALNSINEAFALLDDSGLFDVSTANTAVSRVLGSKLPGTEARDLRAAINSVQALIGFEELQKMRDASPTGGALGQVSEREISFLQALQGSLDIGQSTEQLISNLSDIRDSFTRLKLINSPDGTQFEVDGQIVEKQGDELVLVE